MTTERPIDTNQAVVYNNVAVAPNDQVLTKVMSAPVIYVREDPKCCFCPQTYKVYIHAEAISDGNFDILKDPLFNVVDDACCTYCTPCSVLNFISPLDNTTIHYNASFPKCCEQCCPEKCCPEKCCACVRYGVPMRGSYGATLDMRFGHYARRYCCCTCCGAPTWEFFGKLGESRFLVEMECCQAFNPCNYCCPLKFHIKNGDADIGTVIRSPRSCCGTYSYEIIFPSSFTLEDRLLLIAFCCKRA